MRRRAYSTAPHTSPASRPTRCPLPVASYLQNTGQKVLIVFDILSCSSHSVAIRLCWVRVWHLHKLFPASAAFLCSNQWERFPSPSSPLANTTHRLTFPLFLLPTIGSVLWTHLLPPRCRNRRCGGRNCPRQVGNKRRHPHSTVLQYNSIGSNCELGCLVLVTSIRHVGKAIRDSQTQPWGRLEMYTYVCASAGSCTQ